MQKKTGKNLTPGEHSEEAGNFKYRVKNILKIKFEFELRGLLIVISLKNWHISQIGTEKIKPELKNNSVLISIGYTKNVTGFLFLIIHCISQFGTQKCNWIFFKYPAHISIRYKTIQRDLKKNWSISQLGTEKNVTGILS